MHGSTPCGPTDLRTHVHTHARDKRLPLTGPFVLGMVQPESNQA